MGLLSGVGGIIEQVERETKFVHTQQVIDWFVIHSGKKKEEWEKDKMTQILYKEEEQRRFEQFANDMKCKYGPNSTLDRADSYEYIQRLKSTFYYPQKFALFPYLDKNGSVDKDGNEILKLYTKYGQNINSENIHINADGICAEVYGDLFICQYHEKELPDYIHMRSGSHLWLIECGELDRNSLTRDGIRWDDLGIQTTKN